MAPKKDGRKGPGKPRFREGDRVLCFHGPFLYKAECMKVSVKYRKVKYQVRYFGVKRRTLVNAAVIAQAEVYEMAEGTQQGEVSEKAEGTQQAYSTVQAESTQQGKGTAQPSSLQAPEDCQPSTSEAADRVVLTGADGGDACVALRGRPSPQAEWEDEWLPQSKLLKYNKANLRKLSRLNLAQQRQAAEKIGVGTVTRKKASALQRRNEQAAGLTTPKAEPVRSQTPRIAETGVTRVSTGRGRGRLPGQQSRRRRGKRLLLPRKKKTPETSTDHSDSDSDMEPNQDFFPKAERTVPIPEPLHPWLREEWDMIVRQKRLFRLPAKKNVDSILEDYKHHQRISLSEDASWMEDVGEVVVGIKAYFNVKLGSQLLYKFERPQHAEILASMPGVPMCQVYGAPHLLRFFVKVEEIMTYNPLAGQSFALLLQHFNCFLNYLVDNLSVLFSSSDYDFAPPEYYCKAF